MFVTVRPASDGPALSCTQAYTSISPKCEQKVLKKSIRGTLRKAGRSAFTSAPPAVARFIGILTLGLSIMVSRSVHLRIPIFHRRPSRSGKRLNMLGSICRRVSSIFDRHVFRQNVYRMARSSWTPEPTPPGFFIFVSYRAAGREKVKRRPTGESKKSCTIRYAAYPRYSPLLRTAADTRRWPHQQDFRF